MLRIIHADELSHFSSLSSSMFRHRAIQFRDRLGWDVKVDGEGFEKDEYDRFGPHYIVWEDIQGQHGGSLRLMPTSGRTMINDHFSTLTNRKIVHPTIWECTRFCLAPDVSASVSAALVRGALEFGLRLGLRSLVAVFDKQMRRIYRQLGWTPEILGSGEVAGSHCFAGIWHVEEQIRAQLEARSEPCPEIIWPRKTCGEVSLDYIAA